MKNKDCVRVEELLGTEVRDACEGGKGCVNKGCWRGREELYGKEGFCWR